MTQTILRGGRVFDGTRFLDTADVVFDGDQIARVGEGVGAAFPDALVVDVSGKTVLPGLIDLHVHLCSPGAGSATAYSDPWSMQFYNSVANMQATLAAGITSVRDAGGCDLGAKTAVERGIVAGPRIRLSIVMMSQTGGHGDGHLPSGALNPMKIPHPGRPSGVADGVEAVRKTVRSLLRAGADQIKICSTGGVLSASDDPRHSQFTPAEIAVVVEEAAAQGTYVMAHAQGSDGVKNALRAGVRSIEHGVYLDEEAIDLFLEHDAYLVPTLVAPLAVIKRATQAGSSLAPAIVEKAHLVAQDHRASVARAIAAGVKVAMGTDSGVGIHGENLDELVEMSKLGMNLEDVLRATTSVGGELIRDANVGQLAEGFAADAVVVDGALRSSADLATLRASISHVWKDGALAHSR